MCCVANTVIVNIPVRISSWPTDKFCITLVSLIYSSCLKWSCQGKFMLCCFSLSKWYGTLLYTMAELLLMLRRPSVSGKLLSVLLYWKIYIHIHWPFNAKAWNISVTLVFLHYICINITKNTLYACRYIFSPYYMVFISVSLCFLTFHFITSSQWGRAYLTAGGVRDHKNICFRLACMAVKSGYLCNTQRWLSVVSLEPKPL